MTNDYESSVRDIVEFYNLLGGKERFFDVMNNGFGWNRLPKSFMLSAYDNSHKKLLQSYHAEIGHKEVWLAHK